jgi:NAD(P)H-flavin reductase
MKLNRGTILEVQQLGENTRAAVIRLREKPHIMPGQYLHAHFPGHDDELVGVNLFPGGFQTTQEDAALYTTAPPIPDNWHPGEILNLFGPLGKGFKIPKNAGRVALVALGQTSSHLLPLARAALAKNGEVALLTDGQFPKLPANIEISPLAELEEAYRWADYLAFSGSWEEIQQVKQNTAIENIPAPAEVLLLSPMPCSGLASCGICSITDSRGKVRMVCEEGPVFDWREL